MKNESIYTFSFRSFGYKVWICRLSNQKIRSLWPFPWKWSVWRNSDQERTNQNARIYLETILPYNNADVFPAATWSRRKYVSIRWLVYIVPCMRVRTACAVDRCTMRERSSFSGRYVYYELSLVHSIHCDFSCAKRHNDTWYVVLLQVTCNLVLQKTRKEMESQIRKQKLRQISSAASLPNLSKVSVFRCCYFLVSFTGKLTSSSRQLFNISY